MKKFLSFTAVAYESEDVLGHTLAWCSLIPQVLLVVQTTAFILCESKSRQLQAGSLLTGQIINEVINVILKRILQQPRPSNSSRSDYGMPSSHAQFVGFFFVAFITLVTFEQNRGDNSKWKSIRAWVVRLGALLATILTAISSQQQVTVGLIIGFAIGLIWRRIFVNILSIVNSVNDRSKKEQ